MKLFHLSDLHIGKRVNEFSMIEDQKYILSQILHAAKIKKPDGILLSGDIYDSTIPSAEAVQVFDAFLTELSVERIPAFIISGNHDSAERLAFGSSLMGKSGIYFSRVYDGTIEKIPLQDAYGTVWIHLLPFLRPAVVRHALPERAEEVSYVADAVRIALEQGAVDENERNVLLAHQFVTGAKRCEAEELQVGDLDQIPVELFEKFDYVALGHIHSPQKVGRETVRYCGSPLKYSFSEAGQEKSITVVELKEKGTVELRTIPLEPLRDMRKIRGTYLEVTAKSFYENSNCEDYLLVTLTDEEDVPDGMRINPQPIHLLCQPVIVVSGIDHNGGITLAVKEDICHPLPHTGDIFIDPAGVQWFENLLAPVHPAHCFSLKFRCFFRHDRTSFLCCNA